MIINGRQVNRLYAVKSVVSEFVNTREGDRLGLILLVKELTFKRL